jgi:hypothetical protein
MDCFDLMPSLSRKIPGAGYNHLGESLGFHHDGLSVLAERRRITIIGAEDEATARRLMDWLKHVSRAEQKKRIPHSKISLGTKNNGTSK